MLSNKDLSFRIAARTLIPRSGNELSKFLEDYDPEKWNGLQLLSVWIPRGTGDQLHDKQLEYTDFYCLDDIASLDILGRSKKSTDGAESTWHEATYIFPKGDCVLLGSWLDHLVFWCLASNLIYFLNEDAYEHFIEKHLLESGKTALDAPYSTTMKPYFNDAIADTLGLDFICMRRKKV